MTIHFYNPITNKTNTVDEIRAIHPTASIPENADISVLNYYPVVETQEPTYNAITHALGFKIVPVSVKGITEYHREWYVYELPAEQVEANTAKQQEELIQSVKYMAQKRLDDFALTREYDDIKSACSYYGSPVVKYHNDAVDALALRSQTWDILDTLLADVENGVKPMPTSVEEVIALLPTLQWSN